MPKQHRQLAAILFADIVGYTAIMQRDEQEGLLMLKKYRHALQDYVAAHQGKLLKHYGDGTLCMFPSAVEALRCAKMIQVDMSEEPIVPLRIGIHLGDIVIQEDDIYGDGVNIASRIEALGVPGSILITERLVPDIKSHPEFQTTPIGSYNLKNVKDPVNVFALSNPGFPIPRKGVTTGKEVDYGRIKPGLWSKALTLAGVLSVIIVTTFLLYKYSERLFGKYKWYGGGKTEISTTQRSIAALPFENVGDLTENQAFVTGIHDDLLTQISRIEGMRVISRTSVLQYKNTQKTIPTIAQELNVRHILEGGIQRAGDQVRVNVQLIDGQTDEHLWAKTYTKTLSVQNIFNIQSEIVQDIANSLQITLAPTAIEAIQKAPTQNLEAYQWYAKGTEVWNIRSTENLNKAIEYFEKAVALDTTFALGYAGLSQALSLCINYACREVTGLGDKAKYFAEKSLAINPDQAEAYAALGNLFSVYSYSGDTLSFLQSIAHLKKAIELNPNYALPYHWLGFRYLYLGWDQEAIELLRKADSLDPYSTNIKRLLIEELVKTEKYEEAESIYQDLNLDLSQISEFNRLGDAIKFASIYLGLGKKEKVLAIGAELQPQLFSDFFQVYTHIKFGELKKARQLFGVFVQEHQDEDYSNMLEWHLLDAEQGFNELFEKLEQGYKTNDTNLMSLRRMIFSQTLRKDQRYKAFLKKMGLIIEQPI